MNELMEPKERIDAVLKDMDISARQLALSIGSKPQQIYDVQRGQIKNFPASLADKICNKFPTYSRGWLLTGEGEMRNPGPVNPPSPPEKKGLFIPAELVEMFGNMTATIKSQQETIRLLCEPGGIEGRHAAGL